MKSEKDIQESIIEYLKKQEWPSTTEDIAADCKLSWNTAQLHLVKLEGKGKVRYKKVGRQNQWWLNKSYDKEMK
ncbi:MAG: hypothetical protein NT120_04730 [Candidatus Aenigmarchaeota archaeon]|nr:hypothetical protein [Candidatus Aenigmarchaeota archaeon]